MTPTDKRRLLNVALPQETADWLERHVADMKEGVNPSFHRSTLTHALLRFYRRGVETYGLEFINRVERGLGFEVEKAPLLSNERRNNGRR